MSKIRVGIVGATGYAGVELARILYGHPAVTISSAVSKNFEEKNISEVYPNLTGLLDIRCTGFDASAMSKECDVVFTALPHGVSLDTAAGLAELGTRVIDLSGDYRYKSVEIYEKWYGIQHTHPELLEKFTYGLPEINREIIKGSSFIANPGCYPTCCILSLAPLISAGVIDTGSIIVDAVAGVSGAGRTSSLPFQFTECEGNVKAYKVASHRHTSEIEQELSMMAGTPVTLTFTPHLAPIKRGILLTAYASLRESFSREGLEEIFNDFYKDEPFIRLRTGQRYPETKWVAGSNFVDISVTSDERTGRVVVVAAIDNLVKGTAGQAVQNMNIMFGLNETSGLKHPGQYI